VCASINRPPPPSLWVPHARTRAHAHAHARTHTPQLSRTVASCPELLLRPPAALAECASDLSMLLRMAPADVARMAPRAPRLLDGGCRACVCHLSAGAALPLPQL
jgi:hypothetical protein